MFSATTDSGFEVIDLHSLMCDYEDVDKTSVQLIMYDVQLGQLYMQLSTRIHGKRINVCR